MNIEASCYDFMEDFRSMIRIENRYGTSLTEEKKLILEHLKVMQKSMDSALVKLDIDHFLEKYDTDFN